MYTQIDRPLTREALETILSSIDRARICLIGDLCLDVYWHADMRLSELSRETPHYPLPIVEERFSPGGAGNVASNIAALRPGRFSVVGLVGTDWRGTMLLEALAGQGVNTEYVVRMDGITTNTYIKPIRHGISDVAYEDPRLDFENRAALPDGCEEALLDCLEREIERTVPMSLVLDFSGVTFMDSSGIAVALRGWQRMREVGGSVLLRHVAKQPRKVFEASGVGRMMTIE